MTKSIICATLLWSILPGTAAAQERIRIAWAGATPTNAPIWVVEDRKLLAKHGLNGEVISISASFRFARGNRFILK